MELLRSGQEGKFCKLNAVLTFREWIDDFATPETKKVCEQVIEKEVEEVKRTMPKFATMFALTRQSIPAVIEEFDVFVGGDVEVADYQVTGSEDLATEVAARVGRKAAVLMANHGLFAVGKDPKQVLHIAHLIERTAEIVWGARAIGEVVPLPEKVNAQFSSYYRYGRTGSFD